LGKHFCGLPGEYLWVSWMWVRPDSHSQLSVRLLQRPRLWWQFSNIAILQYWHIYWELDTYTNTLYIAYTHICSYTYMHIYIYMYIYIKVMKQSLNKQNKSSRVMMTVSHCSLRTKDCFLLSSTLVWSSSMSVMFLLVLFEPCSRIALDNNYY
jgi:hypothetical protein